MKNLLLFLFTLSTTVSYCQTTDYRSTTLTGTAVQVNAGYTAPRVINIVNDTATVLFVKLYNAITIPYAAKSHPTLTLMVPATGSTTLDLSGFGLQFQNGLWVRIGKGVKDNDSTYNKYSAAPPIVEITY